MLSKSSVGVEGDLGTVMSATGTNSAPLSLDRNEATLFSDISTPSLKSFRVTLSSFFEQTTMSLTNANPDEAAKSAKSASHVLATLPTAARNNALTAIHSALSQSKQEILAANARDLELAKKAAEDGKLSLSIVSRLDLNKKGKWEDMLKGILDVRELEDPGESTRPCSFRH